MKISRFLGVVSTAAFVALSCLPTTVLALILDDGGTYAINNFVGDGLYVENHTTVDVNNGAYITDAAGGSRDTVEVYSSIFNLNGGYIKGSILSGVSAFNIATCPPPFQSSSCGALNINNGYIEGGIANFSQPGGGGGGGLPMNITGGTIKEGVYSTFLPVDISGGNLLGGVILENMNGLSTISGGNISNLSLRDETQTAISGGLIFGDYISIRGSLLDISGGTFEVDRILNDYAHAFIKGGSFANNLEFALSEAPDSSFTFYGDLSLSDPFIGAHGYETWISGTLADGSAISNRITCGYSDYPGAVAPCSNVVIEGVPIPATLWLIGSCLPVVIGASRRKKAT